MTDVLAHYRRCFDSLRARTTTDAPWLMRLRAEAAAQLLEQGFPTVKQEEWRYTNPAVLTERGFAPAGAAGALAPADLEAQRLGLSAAASLVFINGHAISSDGEAPAGVELSTLAELRRSAPERLAGKLGGLADPKRSAFAALNTALVEDGAVVRAKQNTSGPEPIQVRFVSQPESPQDDPSLSSPRLLIVAEPRSELTVWVDYTSVGSDPGFTNAVTEVYCGDGSTVQLVFVQREGEARYQVSNTFVAQERDSQFSSHTLTLSGELVRNDLEVRLAGEGAGCTMNGLFLGSATQRIDNHTLVDHAVPHCTSRELYKGILGGKARGVFRGRVVVRPDAQKTSAEQRNANLLVGEGAEIDTKPQLEIRADDVRCSHGSTVGQLDANALFYLRTRGIGEAEARNLLTRAFAAELISAIPGEGEAVLGELVSEALLRVAGRGAAQ